MVLRLVLGLTDPMATRDVIVREPERIIMTHAASEAGEALVILAFGEEPATAMLPIPPGEWVKRLDAGAARFGGPGESVPESLHSEGTIELTVPSHAALLFERVSSPASQQSS